MATQAEIKQRYAEWQEHCRHVQSITDTALLARETPVEKDRRIRRLQKDYASFCEYYFPHFLQLLLYRMISTQQEAGIVNIRFTTRRSTTRRPPRSRVPRT